MFPSPGLFVWFSVLCCMVVMQAHFSEVLAASLTRKARAPLGGMECKDTWVIQRCNKEKHLCKKLPLMRKYCKKSCGLCGEEDNGIIYAEKDKGINHADKKLNKKWLNFINKFKKLKRIDLHQGMVTDAKKHHINKMAHFLTTNLKKQLKPKDKLKLKVVENEMGHKMSYMLSKYFQKKLIPKAERAMRVTRAAGVPGICERNKVKCVNGGKCINLGVNWYKCGCKPGYTGTDCSMKKAPKRKTTARRGGFNNYFKSLGRKWRKRFGKSHRRPGSATKHHGGSSNEANQRSGGWGKFKPHPASSKGANKRLSGWFKKKFHHPTASSNRVKRSWGVRKSKKPHQRGGSKGMPCDKVDQCRNGGTCSNFRKFNRFGVYYGKWMYYCACPKGFTGKDCERKIVSVCATRAHECLNGATCLDAPATNGKTYLYCNCAPGFRGHKCEKKRKPVARQRGWGKPQRGRGSHKPQRGRGSHKPQRGRGSHRKPLWGGFKSSKRPTGFVSSKRPKVTYFCSPNKCSRVGSDGCLEDEKQCNCLDGFTGTFCNKKAAKIQRV